MNNWLIIVFVAVWGLANVKEGKSEFSAAIPSNSHLTPQLALPQSVQRYVSEIAASNDLSMSLPNLRTTQTGGHFQYTYVL